MDRISQQLIEYAFDFSSDGLGTSARARAAEIVFDTVACAVGGSSAAPAAIIAKLAARSTNSEGATLFGLGKVSPEMAALGNATMVRTYDYNDAYFGHPSDMIAGLLAVGEIMHSPGQEVLSAIALAYEVYGAFSRSAPYHLDIWLDHGVYMNIAVALAAGNLMGMTREELANAQSLALLPNLPLGVCRWGALSMMKGSSTAFAVRSGVFSAMLAKEGFTSSLEPYEGICGLFDAIGRFDLRLPLEANLRVVEMAYIKPIPAENNVIGLVELVPEIRQWTPVEEIESIDVEIATGLDVHLADEPKYDPNTRESADHSLPYILARALVDGSIGLDSYTPERIADPSLRPLMRKIVVTGKDDLKEMMRASRGAEAKPARIRIRAVRGEFVRDVLGHSGHPQTSGEQTRTMLNKKLDLCAQHAAISTAHRERIRSAWWRFADVEDVTESIETLATFE